MLAITDMMLLTTAKKYAIHLLVVTVGFSSCERKDFPVHTEEKSRKDQKNLSDHFTDLEIVPNRVIVFGDSSGSIIKLLNARKKLQTINVRDSLWGDNTGLSRYYESEEMVVTPANRSYIYPGALLMPESIANDEFEPVYGYQPAPIRVRLSFSSSLGVGVSMPTLSASRQFFRDAIMAPDFSGSYIDNFSSFISYISKYEEVKLAYGYNVNERRLFASTNSSFNYNSSNTQYAQKMMATYTVKNFTYTMEDPLENELIDLSTGTPDVFEGISPIYINSVTYGRWGILIVETNNTSSLVKKVFEKISKKILKQSSESFTQAEKDVLTTCRITINLLGSTLGESAIQLLINPDPEALSSFITENVGVFTALDPGVPISYTGKYLKDYSPFKTVFKLDFPKN